MVLFQEVTKKSPQFCIPLLLPWLSLDQEFPKLLIIETDWTSWLKSNSSDFCNSTDFRLESRFGHQPSCMKNFYEFPESSQAVAGVEPCIKWRKFPSMFFLPFIIHYHAVYELYIVRVHDIVFKCTASKGSDRSPQDVISTASRLFLSIPKYTIRCTRCMLPSG